MATLSRRSRTRDILKGTQAFPPEGLREPFKPITYQWTQRFPFGVSGMNISTPADVLQPGESPNIIDFKTNLGNLELAWGYTGLDEPRSSPTEILSLIMYKTLSGKALLIRLDKEKLGFYSGSTWTTINSSMTGLDSDPISSAMVLNTLIFCNGKDEAKRWDQGDVTADDVTADVNAPDAPRYVIGFADRVIYADTGTGDSRNTQRIEWSASGDETDHTSTGAGGLSLVDSGKLSGSDDIMGFSVQNNFLLVIRRHSIWAGTRTGEAALPITFNSRVQGRGCIAPKTIVDCGVSGVAYLGHNNIYLYNPGLAEPVGIGTPIRDRIFDTLLDRDKLKKAHAAYVSATQELWVFIPDSTNPNPRRAFVFNLERYINNNEFVWRERLFVNDISASVGSQVLGLGPGNIAFTESEKKLIIGDKLGDVFDSDSGDTTNDGSAFTAAFESPIFTAGNTRVDLRRVNIAYTATASSTITIDFSIDGGDNWTNNINYALTATTAVQEASIWVPPGIYGRGVQFRVRATGAQTVKFVGYRVGYLQRGPIQGL